MERWVCKVLLGFSPFLFLVLFFFCFGFCVVLELVVLALDVAVVLLSRWSEHVQCVSAACEARVEFLTCECWWRQLPSTKWGERGHDHRRWQGHGVQHRAARWYSGRT